MREIKIVRYIFYRLKILGKHTFPTNRVIFCFFFVSAASQRIGCRNHMLYNGRILLSSDRLCTLRATG